MPIHILQAEVDADGATREALRFRAPLGGALFDSEDQQDREAALSQLRIANKVLAAHNPRMVLKAGAR